MTRFREQPTSSLLGAVAVALLPAIAVANLRPDAGARSESPRAAIPSAVQLALEGSRSGADNRGSGGTVMQAPDKGRDLKPALPDEFEPPKARPANAVMQAPDKGRDAKPRPAEPSAPEIRFDFDRGVELPQGLKDALRFQR